MSGKRLFLYTALAAWLAVGCVSKTAPEGTATPAASATPAAKRSAEGLRFKLSPAKDAPDAEESVPLATPTPLSALEMQPLLRALPSLPENKGEPLALRPATAPPAKAVQQPFPPPAQAPRPTVVPEGPLQILSCSPQGEVEMASQLQITFNQPMVTVTGPGDLKDVPVQLTPQPAGRWRWLGTQTLVFQPEKRFPMATRFEVKVPEQTASASGAKLKESKQFSFQTPTLQLEESYPNGGPQPLHPLLFMRFNQDIDARKVAPELKLRGNSEEIGLRLARPEEIVQDDRVDALVKGAGERRSLVMALKGKLSPGQAYSLELPAGLHSSEGPLGTSQGQAFSFETFQPLKVESSSEKAAPGESWSVNFNNQLDGKKFQPGWVTVEPELPNLELAVRGQTLRIGGRSKGRTSYKVLIQPKLLDRYGQRLEQAQTLTVEVGSAEPSFSAPSSHLLTLDPAGKPEVTVEVTNHPVVRVRAWKVGPRDWDAYVKSLREDDQKVAGAPLLDEQVQTHCEPDQPKAVTVDLSSAFPKGLGQAIVLIEVPASKGHRDKFFSWVQSTRIGLDACADGRQIVSWVNRLDSGAAWPGVLVELLGSKRRAQSDSNGLAILKPETAGTLLVARQGEDVAILPREFNGWNSGAWLPDRGRSEMLWHVVDDRHLYRPGESVHVKGWLRRLNRGPDGDLQAAPPGQVRYQLLDGQRNAVAKGQVVSGGLGGFTFEVKLPKDLELGTCQLMLSGPENSNYTHFLEVQEFRRPEFEVTASAEPGVSQIGKSAVVSAKAAYFSGGPLGNSKVNWQVRSSPTDYTPPGWEGYSFGSWTPWWAGDQASDAPDNHTTQEGRTDSAGRSQLKVDFLSVDPPHPHNLEAEATLQDVNRQTWTARTSLLVHPSALYVGLKSDTTFVQKGQPLKASVVVTDVDGKALAGKTVKVRSYRQQWDAQGELWEADGQERTLTSAAQPVAWEVPGSEGGTYRLEARVQDDENRANACDLTLWVAGQQPKPSTRVEQETLTLVPGKREYQAGETAEVLVQAPFAPAELLVTSRRDGIASVQRLSAPQGSLTVKLPLREVDIPGLTLQVDAVGTQLREDGKTRRPAYASGSVALQLSRAPRRLKVEVTPGRSQLQPGQATQVEVQLRDDQGQPVSGVVTLMAVDESVLALSGYDPADPLETFCPLRESGVSDDHLRQFLELRKPLGVSDQLNAGAEFSGTPAPESEAQPAPFVVAGAAGAINYDAAVGNANFPPPKKFTLRSNFTPLAAFEPYVQTDARGHAKISFKLPDNLTRYRLIALGQVGVKQFGKGESSLTARKPLQIRPSPPRFLNFGDQFQMPVVLQNQTDEAMQVELVCRGSNVKVDGGEAAGYRVELKPQDRQEIRIACATDQAGTARFQFGASYTGVPGGGNDATQIQLPVWTPATSEAFATYGVLDQGALRQPVQRPTDIFPQFGNLSLTTSSTALSELTDSLLYLVGYPYECSEQLASRVLSTAALRDVLGAFQSPQLEPAKLQAALQSDLTKLRGLQNDDGGWDYWQRDKPSAPYLSVHVAHMLVRLRSKGYKVDADCLEQALAYLRDIDNRLTDYSPESKRAIRAYALYVRQLEGHPDAGKALALLKEAPLEQQGPEVLAWLLPTLAQEPSAGSILTYFESHSNQSAASAQFSFSYRDSGPLILYSDRRDDALILESLVRVRPTHPLIPKLVRGLLDQRRQGRWENTQENCWVLLAMDAYFQKFEKLAPDFVARIWLGDQSAGQQIFRGRQKGERAVEIPMARVPEKADLVLAKEGKGRLYYRVGMSYASRNLRSEALDNGFAVERAYEAVEDNRDVRQDSEGNWHIKAGALVRVRLSMQTPVRRYQVALVDALPAGLEALNPELVGTERVREPQSRLDGWWSSHWFDHQNLRDERVEAFTQLLWEGVYQYDYLARATTPGTFVAPPCKAEEMYHPETFGRTRSEKVIVE